MPNQPPSLVEPDYRALFEAAPDRYIALTPDLTIVAVSDAYLQATMRRREELLGRRLFDAFPLNPDDPHAGGMAEIRASLERVRQYGVADTVAVEQYDIRRPEAEGGAFEQRFWSLLSYPVLGPDRGLRYIMHRVEDVSDAVRLRAQGTEQARRTAQMEHQIYRYAREVQAARGEAEAERERLRSLLLQAPGLLAVMHGPDFVYRLANEPYRQFMGGNRSLEGLALREAVPDIAPEILAILQKVYTTGERFVGREFPITIDWGVTRQPQTKYLDFVYEPSRDGSGAVDGIIVFAYEVTEQVRARQQLEESEHRLRAALGEAQAAQLRLELLSDATVRLTSLLDYQSTLQAVAELAVPTLADFCFFDVVGEHGALERVAWAHVDGLDHETFAAVHRYPAPSPESPNPISAALGGAGTQFVPQVTDAWLQQIAVASDHLEFMRSLRFHTLLTVPVLARELLIGALTFCLVDPARSFSVSDRELAEELARRAALAIDNARLYAQAERARVEAERRLAELAAVIDSMPDGVYIGTEKGITMANNQGMLLLGYDTLADLDRDVGSLAAEIETRELETGRRLAAEEEVFAIALQGRPIVRDVLVRNRKTGQDVMLRSAAAPIRRDGQILGAVAVNTDITERKRAETERGELLVREQAARAEAEAAVRVRDEFLSVAAHELKTPVTSMRGYAQLVLRQIAQGQAPEPERLERALSAINQQSFKLTRFIDQLLDVSKIAAGRLVLHSQRLDVGALVQDVTASLQALTGQHTLEVAVSGETEAFADPLRLEQVLTNLVTNAIKYSPDGGSVWLAVDKPDPDHVQISVTDHGIGVPHEHRPFIFDRFYQAHGTGYFGGMGLGLSISRHIVEMHGGMLRAEFPARGGTRMVVVLPVAPAANLHEHVEAAV